MKKIDVSGFFLRGEGGSDPYLEYGGSGDCLLVGDNIYVSKCWPRESGRSLVVLAKMDLSSALNPNASCEEMARYEDSDAVGMVDAGDYLVLIGSRKIFFSKLSGKMVFSEYDEAPPSHWPAESISFYEGDKYFKAIGLDRGGLGFDIYNLEEKEVVGYVVCPDVSVAIYIGDDVMYGISQSGNPIFWILSSGERILECPLSEIFSDINTNFISFSRFRKLVAVSYSNLVFVYDLSVGGLVKRYNLHETHEFVALCKRLGKSAHYFQIAKTSFSDDSIVLYGRHGFPFLCGINFITDKIWVISEWRPIKGVYNGGGEVQGLDGAFPAVWDVSSGDNVWRGRSKVFPNRIQVSHNWVVYSSLGGEIQCYKRTPR